MHTQSRKDLIPVPAYREQNANAFPSETSVEWFIRQNRAELIKAGAIVKLAKRWMVSPATFDATAMEIGKRTAQGAAQ